MSPDQDLVAADPHGLVLRGAGDALALPPTIDRAGPKARRRFVEFFAAEIRNPRTRAAYGTAVARFFAWCDARGLLQLEQLAPLVIAAYVENLGRQLAPASVKQHLAALRMLFDYLVVGQILPFNPAASVHGPRHSVRKGKTPVLFEEEARALLSSIDVDQLIGLRDRALLAVMVYSFARVSAVIGMRVRDYASIGRRAWFVFAEKGGKHHQVPAHHKAAEALDAYLQLASGAPDAHLFRSFRNGQLTDRPLDRSRTWAMIRRRANAAGITAGICCHTFRATGITDYLSHGGTLETAAVIAGHASTRTTQLYDRRSDTIDLQEVERIRI